MRLLTQPGDGRESVQREELVLVVGVCGRQYTRAFVSSGGGFYCGLSSAGFGFGFLRLQTAKGEYVLAFALHQVCEGHHACPGPGSPDQVNGAQSQGVR